MRGIDIRPSPRDRRLWFVSIPGYGNYRLQRHRRSRFRVVITELTDSAVVVGAGERENSLVLIIDEPEPSRQ